MNKKTYNLLRKCTKYGIKRVCIGVAHPIVPSSIVWSSGARNSIFGIKSPKNDNLGKDGWPAIWQVVQEYGIDTGCGNQDHHNIRIDGLEQGAYRYYNGKWRKL